MALHAHRHDLELPTSNEAVMMEEEMVRCERCGEEIPYELACRSISGGYICELCYDDLYS